jgi:hypothetical protein
VEIDQADEADVHLLSVWARAMNHLAEFNWVLVSDTMPCRSSHPVGPGGTKLAQEVNGAAKELIY